jgi:hypothetical protein
MQNANEQLIREAAQNKQVDEVLTDCIEKLGCFVQFTKKQDSNHLQLQIGIESLVRDLL